MTKKSFNDITISQKNLSFKGIVGSSTALARQSKLVFWPIFPFPGCFDFGKPFQNLTTSIILGQII